jgi:hypothetical protein
MIQQMYGIQQFTNNYFPDIPHYVVEYDKVTYSSRDYLDCVMFVLDRKINVEYYADQEKLEYLAKITWCKKYGCE